VLVSAAAPAVACATCLLRGERGLNAKQAERRPTELEDEVRRVSEPAMIWRHLIYS